MTCKKYVFKGLVLVLMVSFCSCNAKKSSDSQKDDEKGDVEQQEGVVKQVDSFEEKECSDTSLVFTKIEWTDSIQKDVFKVIGKCICEYPIHNNSLVANSISNSICELFSDSTHLYKNHIPELIKKEGIDELEAMISSEDFSNYDEEYIEELRMYPPPPSDFYIEFKKLYEDDTYITMQVSSSVYMSGAAHGIPSVYGITYRKKDGSIVNGKDLLKAYNPQVLRKYIINGLKEYYSVKTDEELMSGLLYFEYNPEFNTMEDFYNKFPLPSIAPYIVGNNKVQIIYGPYEIACYADGMPECVIPMPENFK